MPIIVAVERPADQIKMLENSTVFELTHGKWDPTT